MHEKLDGDVNIGRGFEETVTGETGDSTTRGEKVVNDLANRAAGTEAMSLVTTLDRAREWLAADPLPGDEDEGYDEEGRDEVLGEADAGTIDLDTLLEIDRKWARDRLLAMGMTPRRAAVILDATAVDATVGTEVHALLEAVVDWLRSVAVAVRANRNCEIEVQVARVDGWTLDCALSAANALLRPWADNEPRLDSLMGRLDALRTGCPPGDAGDGGDGDPETTCGDE